MAENYLTGSRRVVVSTSPDEHDPRLHGEHADHDVQIATGAAFTTPAESQAEQQQSKSHLVSNRHISTRNYIGDALARKNNILPEVQALLKPPKGSGEEPLAAHLDARESLIDHTNAPRETVTEFLNAVPGPFAETSRFPVLTVNERPYEIRTTLGSGSRGSNVSVGGEITDLNQDRHNAQAVGSISPSTPATADRALSSATPGAMPGGTYSGDNAGAISYPGGNRTIQGRDPESTDVILPRWQPDAEVTYCPICSTQFSFFVRKHHCRKCGRVVCNACSPHRITIPYQFIVQPPDTASPDIGSNLDGGFADRYGGMKVRLCNPCVPDPNTMPPQSSSGNDRRQRSPPSYYINSGHGPYTFNENATAGFGRESGAFANLHQLDPLSSRARGMSTASGTTATERQQDLRYSGRYGGTISDTGAGSSYPNPSSSRMVARNETHSSARAPRNGESRGYPYRPQSLSVNSLGPANPQPHYRSLIDVLGDGNGVLHNSDQRPLPPVPRIAEDDECPVCHRELAPRTLPDVENVRAAHIMQCINEQLTIHSGHSQRPGVFTSVSQPGAPSSSSAPSPQPQANLPPTAAPMQRAPSNSILTVPTVPSSSRPAPSSLTPNTPEARMAAREQAHAAVVFAASQPSIATIPARRTGMFPYKATEKDCIDDAECTICLEEFEVGDPMARLECLCRFHRHCIQEWFVNHPGRCPVHQHDGYGF